MIDLLICSKFITAHIFIDSHLFGIKSAQKGLNPSRPSLPKRSMHPYLHAFAAYRRINRMQSHQLEVFQRPIKGYSSTEKVNRRVVITKNT